MAVIVEVFESTSHTLQGLPMLVLMEICTHNSYFTNKILMRVSRMFFDLLTNEKMDYIMFRKTTERSEKYITTGPPMIHPILQSLNFRGCTNFDQISVRVGARVVPLLQTQSCAWELAVSPASETLQVITHDICPHRDYKILHREQGVRVGDVTRWLCESAGKHMKGFGSSYRGFKYSLDGFHCIYRSEEQQVRLIAKWSYWMRATPDVIDVLEMYLDSS